MSSKYKAIIYSDAGFTDGAGTTISGYGIHGYVYIDQVPKRGTGNPKAVPTQRGYAGPLDDKGAMIEGEKVTVLRYIDIVGGGSGHGSSGEAELNGFNEALAWLIEQQDIEEAIIYCDNRLVTLGVNGHLEAWKKRNWMTTSGTPVKFKSTWLKCADLLSQVKAKTKLEVLWIKGHNGNLGNELADKLATKGKVGTASDGSMKPVIKESMAEGYWKPKVDIPRILQAPRWYFDTVERNYINGEGFAEFYCGSHGPKEKDSELLGKPYSDNYLGVIRTKTYPEILDLLREYAYNVMHSNHGKIVVAFLDKILSIKEITDFNTYGLSFHRLSKRQIFIKNAEKETVMTEMTPQGQGFRMMGIWKSLSNRLDDIRNNDNKYQITDITDLLYESEGPKGKQKLRSKYTLRVKHFDLKVKFNLERSSETAKIFEQKVRIIFGSDILSRNQLSAIAENVVKVCIVTWRESDQVGRYGTYIEMDNGDCGLWSRYEANYILKNPT